MEPIIGTKPAAIIEPNETYLVIIIIATPITVQIIAVGQCNKNTTPREVAILPP